jgi:hypothetical protein
MVEQRPFKALVVGSSPTQPIFPKNGMGLRSPGLFRALVYLLDGES